MFKHLINKIKYNYITNYFKYLISNSILYNTTAYINYFIYGFPYRKKMENIYNYINNIIISNNVEIEYNKIFGFINNKNNKYLVLLIRKIFYFHTLSMGRPVHEASRIFKNTTIHSLIFICASIVTTEFKDLDLTNPYMDKTETIIEINNLTNFI